MEYSFINLKKLNLWVAPPSNPKWDIRYWIQKFQASLPPDEKFDGIVLPLTPSIENEALVNWLKEVKQTLQEVKILAINPQLTPIHHELDRKERIAIPAQAGASIDNTIKEARITMGDPAYHFPSGVDVVVKNLRPKAEANALREMLGMEPLKAPGIKL